MSVKKASSSLVSRSRVGFTPTGGGAAVTISNVIVTDSSWNNLDDTAVGTSSSYIKIIGSGFVVNPSVYVGTTQVSSGSITFVSSTELRVVLPSLSLGTQNLFVFNTDYSGAIWSAGLVVSGFPDYTQTTYTSSTPLSVSVQLLATGDAPLTYALQGGSSLPAGTSLSSSGLITGTTTDGTYQFTVIVSDAQNQSFQQQLTLTITSTDQYFNRTVLAINGDVNTFVSDGSTNNFPITINGDTKPSKFSPYNTNWSVYIDGTDYLEVTQNASLAFQGGGAWTWESFVYPITGGIVYSSYTGPSNSGGSFIFSVGTSIGFSWILNGTDTWSFDSGSTGSTANSVPLNAWSHCAVSYDGAGSLKFFVNGTLNATFSRTVNVDTLVYNIRVGRSMHPDFPSQFGGYLSNMRFVKGTTLYTSSFTAPTSALTAVANTVFLGFTSNRMTYDASSVNNTITPFNTPQTTSFGPFTETDATTGSAYFDGTGDYLIIADNAALRMDSGNFTIEFWINFSSIASYQTIFSKGYIGSGDLLIQTGNGNGRLLIYASGSAVITESGTAAVGEWVHYALVRNNTTLTLYRNGVSSGSASNSTNFNGTVQLIIGAANAGGAGSLGQYPITGYIADVRVIKGTAVYTATFTPPTAPLTAIANTSLLALQTRQPVNNHTFIDVSGNNNLITRAGNVSQGSFSPFSPAGWSGYFDGTGDYLKIGTTNATLSWLNTAGSVGTIEAWIYPTGFRTGAQVYTHPAILGMGGTYLNFGLANGVPRFYWWTGSPNTLDAGSAVSLNTWTHIALVFNGSGSNNLKMYVNGTLAATGTFTNINWASASGGDNVYIGTEESAGTSAWLGYISNLRIVNGTALYTSTFTPPTSALTAVTNTTLLACQSNRFRDNSTNNYTITRNNDAAVVNFSPFAPTAAYSPITHGGSAYFDASVDYTAATGTALNLGSNNFTIEGWYYFNNGAENAIRIMGANYNSWGAGGLYYGKHSNNSGVVTVWVYNHSTSGPLLADPTLPPTKEWVHYAVVRSGNTWTLYRNGISVSTGTTSASLSTTNAIYIVGGSPESSTYTFGGYISGFKITNGTALYTSNFSVPTSPATTSNSTSLLLSYNNAGIVDTTSRNVMETVGDAKIVTSTRKYGTGSMYFDGTGDYLASFTDLTKLNCTFRTGDFTIEAWLNFATVGTNLGIADTATNTTGGSTEQWYMFRRSTNVIGFGIHGADPIISSTTNTAASTWYHLAVTRSGTSVRMFINGVLESSTTNSTDLVAASLHLGLVATPYTMHGYIDDFRITKGVARYTANFTPPSSTFLAQ